MSDRTLMEEPLHFGENGRLFGILTRPSAPRPNAPNLPVFVWVNSGFLHRVGPRRLYVRLARALADEGFTTLRVDLSGRGDSFADANLTTEESLADDYRSIVSVLEARLGRVTLVVGGLCSGADDAIRLAFNDSRVVGMVLMDAVCDPDAGFKARDFVRRCTNFARYRHWLKKRIKGPKAPGDDTKQAIDKLSLREFPVRRQMQEAFRLIHERNGQVLSLFTGYAEEYYNQVGQMARVLELNDNQQFCIELFWPDASHTLSLELHRSRLIEAVKTWAAGYIHQTGSNSHGNQQSVSSPDVALKETEAHHALS